MTAEQQHWYDCPYQVGTNSTDTPLNDATSHVVKLLPSDTIILATDGLGDNLWDQEILSEVSGDNESGTPKRSIQDIADTLCKRARAIGEDQWGESPFMVPRHPRRLNRGGLMSRKKRLWRDCRFMEENWMISVLLLQRRNWMSNFVCVVRFRGW